MVCYGIILWIICYPSHLDRRALVFYCRQGCYIRACNNVATGKDRKGAEGRGWKRNSLHFIYFYFKYLVLASFPVKIHKADGNGIYQNTKARDNCYPVPRP